MATDEPQALSPEALARRYVWWQDFGVTLQDVPHLLCQIMHLGTARDYVAARSCFGEEAFRQALLSAGPEAMDERSWGFWHIYFRLPMRPMPKRSFGEADGDRP